MRKRIAIGLLMLFVCSFFVNAELGEETTDPLPTDTGDPLMDYMKSTLSWNDRLKLVMKPLTVIGGAECSANPDFAKDYSPSTTKITKLCHPNDDHRGVAFQLWELLPDQNRYVYLGEKQVTKGGKECFSVEFGKQYRYDLYYCDQVLDVCGGKYYSECHTQTDTKRVRVCDDGRVQISWQEYVDKNAPWCPGSEPVKELIPPAPGVPPPSPGVVPPVPGEVGVIDNVKDHAGHILIGVGSGGVVGFLVAGPIGAAAGVIVGGIASYIMFV